MYALLEDLGKCADMDASSFFFNDVIDRLMGIKDRNAIKQI